MHKNIRKIDLAGVNAVQHAHFPPLTMARDRLDPLRPVEANLVPHLYRQPSTPSVLPSTEPVHQQLVDTLNAASGNDVLSVTALLQAVREAAAQWSLAASQGGSRPNLNAKTAATKMITTMRSALRGGAGREAIRAALLEHMSPTSADHFLEQIPPTSPPANLPDTSSVQE